MEGEKSATTAQKFKLTELLKELITTQVQASKVDAAHFQTSTKEFVLKKRTKLHKDLEKQADIYKQNKEKIAGIIKEHEGLLKQARDVYRSEKRTLIQEKGEWEKTEAEDIAQYQTMKQEFTKMPGYKEFAKHKAEITQLRRQGRKKEADKKRDEFNEYKSGLPKRVKALQTKISMCIQNGNVEEVEKQMKVLKKLQRECKLAEYDTELGKIKTHIKLCRENIKDQNKKIESCENEFETEVDKITSSQENALSKVDKQNVFQKLLVKVFGSTKQFNNNVMTPLKQKMKKFKEETLPVKIENMERRAKKRRQYIAEQTGKAVKTVGKTFTSIINGARSAKNTIVNGLEQKMAERIEENRQKVTTHNLNNPDRRMGDAESKALAGKYQDGILTSHDER